MYAQATNIYKSTKHCIVLSILWHYVMLTLNGECMQIRKYIFLWNYLKGKQLAQFSKQLNKEIIIIIMNPFKTSKDSLIKSLSYNYLQPVMHKATREGPAFSSESLPELKPELESSAIHGEFSKVYQKCRGSLLWALFRSIGAPLYAATFLSICLVVIYAAEPTFIRKLISFVDETQNDSEFYEGVRLCICITALVFFRCIFYNAMYALQHIAITKTATALCACVFEKSLRLSATEYDKQGPGKILYLINKAKRVSRFMPSIQSLIVDPIKLLLTSILFTREVGYGFFLVVLAGAISLSLNVSINGKLRKLNEKRDTYGKQGMKHTSEYIKGIKAIKLNVWEEYAKDKISTAYEHVKECEIDIGLWWQINEGQKEMISQIIVISAIFISFWLEGSLSASKVYMIVVLYQQLRYPLFSLASLFSRYSEAKQSLRMIEEFLRLEEKTEAKTEQKEAKLGEMILDNVTASCYEMNQHKNGPETRTILSDLNFRISPGELVGIVGQVGSGKSLLFRCILGEVKIDKGSVVYGGKIVYLPQEPWIFTDTLRNNVLMNSEYDEEKYEKVLIACELKEDIGILPEKDMTVIGSRGVNLSGGQRQRVALARAIYNPGDIYIFDDSLSQLDSQAAANVFDNILHNHLKGKTRLFVTGNARKLVNFQRILVIENGTVSAEGSYPDLLAMPSFSALTREQASPKMRKANKSPTQTPTNSSVNQTATKDSHSTSSAPKKPTNRTFQWSDLKPFFHKGNWPLIVLFGWIVLMIVMGEGFRDRWLFTWSCNCYSWDFYSYLSVYVFIILANLVSSILKQYVQKTYEKRFMKQMNSFVMDKTLNAPLWWYDVTSSGKIIRCVTSNFEEIFFVFAQIGNVSQNFGLFVIGVYHILAEVPEFVLSVCALVTLIVFLRKTSAALVTSSMRFEELSEESLNTNVQELLDGLYTIRANQGEYINWAKSKVYKIVDNQARARLVRNLTTLWMDLRWKLLTTIVFGTVIFACFSRQQIMVTSAIGFTLQYTLKMCWTLELLCMNYEELSTYIISYGRLLNFIEEIPQEQETVSQSEHKDWPIKGRISARDLYLRYQDHLPYVIRGATFDISPGDKVAISGRSGTGKSTILLGLLRIIEPHPLRSIEIDGKNTKDIPLKQLRSKVIMIPQEPWVFSGTIRNNLDPLGKEPNSSVMEILREVNLTELLEKKLKDYSDKTGSVLDIEVAENGSNLSQGEKQLLCLARALVRKPKILLLDEATANLDEATERRVLEVINNRLKDSTVITISHKENPLSSCNRMLRVQNHTCEQKQCLSRNYNQIDFYTVSRALH
eukprot:TRINITY_DN135238_c0_g1_i1.p1 TRINITY_DN135238_c0_g1~~TRINITY_DN135238_c0_g1_i1.p1  ORF type:complete len:1308 (-),score=96.44 TRINITY_DN135238_c0_g1_i1:33-3956(-)